MKATALISLLSASSLALAAPDRTTPAAPITLAEAESVALRHAPEIAAAYFQAEAAKQAVRETRAGFFPQLNAEFTAVGTGEDLSDGFNSTATNPGQTNRLGATGGLNNPTVLSRESNGVTISQLITDFGRTANLTAASRLYARSEAEKSLATKAVVLFQVDKAYIKTLESEALLTVAQQTVAARQLVLDQVTAMVNSKLKSDIDLSIAKVSVGQANLLLAQAQNALDEAQAELSAALGCHQLHRFTLVEEPQYPLPASDPQNLVLQALHYRPEVTALRSEAAGASRYASAERAARFPKITAMGSAGRTPIGDPGVEGNYSAAGINVEVPIFDGGRLSARYQEAVLKQRAAQKRLEEEEEQVTKDVNITWLDVYAASKKIAVIKELFSSANEALELAKSRFQLGATSMVDLSQAQLNATQAEIEYAGANYEYQMQCIKLEFATGALKFRSPLPGVR